MENGNSVLGFLLACEGDMNDRDTFAAAALTGLLAQGDDGSFSEESYVRAAYRWADVMLRERDKQPAPPCVETDGFSSGSSSDLINRNAERESPRRECEESQLRDVPQLDNSRAAGGPEHHILEHQQPTLTDEEREAVEAAARIIDEYEDEMDGFRSGAAATLRKLLDRLA